MRSDVDVVCIRFYIKPPSDSLWLGARSCALDSPSGSTRKRNAMIKVGVSVIAGAMMGLMIGISFSRVFSGECSNLNPRLIVFGS